MLSSVCRRWVEVVGVVGCCNNKYFSSKSGDNPLVVGILGGGLTGLSAAYYLSKVSDTEGRRRIQPVVLEKSHRAGGWVNTYVTGKGTRYELGPRTIRPAGVAGLNTLDLCEELGLDTQVLYVEKSHPSAMNRLVFVDGRLCALPSNASVLWRTQQPFSSPLCWAILKDVFSRRKRLEDDSLHNFVTRRFGKEIANYIIDPLIRGICAGSSKDISAKFLMKQMFEFEQRHGSVLVGMLASRLRRNKEPCKLTDDQKNIGLSKIAMASRHGWAVWTLETGLETLASSLEARLVHKDVQIRKGTQVTGVSMDKRSDHVVVEFQYQTAGGGKDNKRTDSIVCDHVISCVSASTLSQILRHSKPSRPEMWSILETVRHADLQVTGLTYENPDVVQHDAFGFLVPSFEKKVEGLLGVVFDTNSFPQGDKTVLTVMSRGQQGEDAQPIEKVLWYVEKTLGITAAPTEHHSAVLRQCIPQYSVGHYERIDAVRRFIGAAGLPMTLAGAAYDGVSVNDCVFGGRNAATAVAQGLLGPPPT